LKHLLRGRHLRGLFDPKSRKAGADGIVSPDFTGGMRIASAMGRPHVVNFVDQMLHSVDGQHVVKAGAALVLLANPSGRAHLEQRLNR